MAEAASPRRQLILRWVLAVVALPVMALFVVPAVLLRLFQDTPWAHAVAGPAEPAFWLALLATLGAAVLFGWTASLFFRFGNGTPAPWDPPRELVVRGPYRHVRNPMITGAALLLVAEALLFRSWPLFGWFLVFALANVVYIPTFEEPGLERRLGEAYREYRRAVPRWLPRVRPWTPPERGRARD